MGFDLGQLPGRRQGNAEPGSQWLQVRKERPDYMIMWGWGAMNPTAVKEAAKIRYPMDKFIGVWWSARTQTCVIPVGEKAKGFKAAELLRSRCRLPGTAGRHQAPWITARARWTARTRRFGEVLYNRRPVQRDADCRGDRAKHRLRQRQEGHHW
jgi:branched-chain amino acid transport system substrate-binding protein